MIAGSTQIQHARDLLDRNGGNSLASYIPIANGWIEWSDE
jgi:hypothetical protein